MKKLIILFLLVTININAQMTVTKKETGTQILNNDIIIFNTVADATATLGFYVNNTSTSPINTKINFVSATNATGTGMELCFANSCLSGITIGDSFPRNGSFPIPAMGRNGDYDHFYNTYAGNGTSTQDYVFKFYQVDGSGNEIGNSITFTYRYIPNLAVNTFSSLESMGIRLSSNIIENQLNINLDNHANMTVYDTAGRVILSQKLVSGANDIEVSEMKSGMYLLNFVDDNQKIASIKMIKR